MLSTGSFGRNAITPFVVTHVTTVHEMEAAHAGDGSTSLQHRSRKILDPRKRTRNDIGYVSENPWRKTSPQDDHAYKGAGGLRDAQQMHLRLM